MSGNLAIKENHIIKYHDNLEQGSEEWHALRRGILTASEMKLIVTPTLKVASNDKERAYFYELAAQRITGYTEPCYISYDMLRGQEDEIEARELYSANYAPVQQVGFVTNETYGFTIGYSPDGLVGDDGLIEIKSRNQKYQLKTILECVPAGEIPDEYVIQVQTGLLVTQRKWCDFISFCGGMDMAVIRVFPDARIQSAIIEAGSVFDAKVKAAVDKYRGIKAAGARMIPTERRIELEMTV